MNSVIYDPLKDFDGKYRALHAENTDKFFEALVQRSGVDIEKNRETVRLYNECKENWSNMRGKLNWWRFLRVLMCITLVLIPLVIKKITPKIKDLKSAVEEADRRAEELLKEANDQMLPLNSLFTGRDALNIVEETLPLLSFEDHFSVQQEADMQTNYDFCECNEDEQSTLEVLAGSYNGNPFLFEKKMQHTMGMETYHGYKTIHWTETYRDADGKLRTRTESEKLHAMVTKPKPFYGTRVVLNYCAQGGPDLSFTRTASHLEQRSEKEIEKLVKRGEKELKRMTDSAIKQNDDFVSMSNTKFEVLFDALNRDNEVQFRTLFTPLAQTNMVSLLLSKIGYGDDFLFVKAKRTNRIIAEHSQGRELRLLPEKYISYAFDEVKSNFINLNAEFFKAVYFDFAPLLAIPMYQEHPVHSLKPVQACVKNYSFKECEALVNVVDPALLVHPDTKTQAILKTSFVTSQDRVDETCITAYSYDIEKRVDIVPVRGGDGHYHDVSVEWDEYLPLKTQNNFYISAEEPAEDNEVIARHNGLCIFKS